MLRVFLALTALAASSGFVAPLSTYQAASRHAVLMRQPDSRSSSREKLLPDILKAMDEVAVFISKADASRQRKPEVPDADHIEAYVAMLQTKIDLLSAEAKVLREAEAKGEPGQSKVRWTDIDGNLHNDAVWLKQPRIGF
uniref:Uncharacterized protein n=1 Tax=Haptolina brevifila TaxID=156173 RepID=A0A7S2N4V9_9EUKA|mmetsp:Transcript_66435/g.131726  ORF Transcript_66435/g.131726 Transcript_66435/m.131726 type:complete len:140 (+) Transcript_66435:60-479(+)